MAQNMSRRDFMALVGGAISMTVMAGCAGKQSEQGTKPETTQTNTESNFTVDYGTSELYTQEEMDAAVELIMAEFTNWKGCTMQRLAYAGDEESTNSLAYCNEMREPGAPEIADAIVFKADFHSPSAEEAEGTAWAPDTDYTDYSWILGRALGESWQLFTWGYA